MAVNLRGVTTVLLPGTGSDDDYVYRAFYDFPEDVLRELQQLLAEVPK